MKRTTTLGLDLGAQSLGWALTAQQAVLGKPCIRVEAMGAHVFEAGMEGDIHSGREESRNATRRQKRLLRRQYDRRRRRMTKIRNLLQKHGLLPEERDFAKALLKLDAQTLLMLGKVKGVNKQTLAHVAPYALRARALDAKLEPFLLGRALYHLAQRRGFQSNRKEKLKGGKEEEAGVVKQGIEDLAGKMKAAKARTLGEYFAGLDPEVCRIRERYTDREMYKAEFESIWKKQKKHHAALLADGFHDSLYKAFFFQRKLKTVRHLVGDCAYEKNAKRCPWYRPEAQRFRILQTVNNLHLISSEGVPRCLTEDERNTLLGVLDRQASLPFKEAKKLLGFKPREILFDLEDGGEKRLLGNTTQAKMLGLFGDQWLEWEETQQEKVLQDLVSVEKEEILCKRGQAYGLEGAALDDFCDLVLEPDYCGLSRRALKKLLPLMEKGISYMTAVAAGYPEHNAAGAAEVVLPGVDTVFPDLRNPVVHRCLTELRHCVNAIVKQYGVPDRIHVELARDIKSTKKERMRRTQRMRENEKRREDAKRKWLKLYGIQDPSRDDILKLLLWDECNQVCPYTGKSIGRNELPKMDIEHIIPYSRSLDDSYVNKTLCDPSFNRKVKRNRSPYEALHGTPRYDEVIERVKKWATGSPVTREKLRRFQLSDLSEFEDFTSRHLNDTRYASREAVKYLGRLYGGRVDSKGRQRVFTLSGGITAKIRNAYQLNGLLGGERKNRDDHRHHAVDALVIALTKADAVEEISRAASRSYDTRIRFNLDEVAGEGFLEHVRERVEQIVVTHHVSRRARGGLHKDTLYGHIGDGFCTQRVRVEDLGTKDLTPERIPEPGVLAGILGKMKKLGEADPAKAFKDAKNLPRVLDANGKPGKVIRRVRLRIKSTAFPVGSGEYVRYVQTDSIHHVEIVARLDDKGNETAWEGHVVPMLEAYQRKRLKQPLIQRDHGPGTRFKFTMAGGDVFEMEYETGKRECFIIRVTANSGQFWFVRLVEARRQADLKKAQQWLSKTYATVR
ncbi:MAG: type II CRISPR RNA-guided endonuclease Cas9, partial [Synergistales bacterium]|nr:type II CRISPR RNA-guided endonuclease Cas9 [Synergistales bacterium]